MTIDDHCAACWSAMTPDDRLVLLTDIKASSPTFYSAGRTIGQLALTSDFSSLPPDVRSYLIWSATEQGFSMDELQRNHARIFIGVKVSRDGTYEIKLRGGSGR